MAGEQISKNFETLQLHAGMLVVVAGEKRVLLTPC